MRLKQKHIETLGSREIYVQKKVTDENILKNMEQLAAR
jgi:hypothetical protein